MAKINSNYDKLSAGYLFPEIARRVNAYTESDPEKAKRLIRCGIGDVTEPVPVAAREAMKKAVDELGDRGSFRGYGPEQGYPFLRESIARNAYAELGIDRLILSPNFGSDPQLTRDALQYFAQDVMPLFADSAGITV